MPDFHAVFASAIVSFCERTLKITVFMAPLQTDSFAVMRVRPPNARSSSQGLRREEPPVAERLRTTVPATLDTFGLTLSTAGDRWRRNIRTHVPCGGVPTLADIFVPR